MDSDAGIDDIRNAGMDSDAGIDDINNAGMDSDAGIIYLSYANLLSLFPTKKQRKEMRTSSSAKYPTFNGTKGKIFDEYKMDFTSVAESKGLADFSKSWVLRKIYVPIDHDGSRHFTLNLPEHPFHGQKLRVSELKPYNKWISNNKAVDKALSGEIKNSSHRFGSRLFRRPARPRASRRGLCRTPALSLPPTPFD